MILFRNLCDGIFGVASLVVGNQREGSSVNAFAQLGQKAAALWVWLFPFRNLYLRFNWGFRLGKGLHPFRRKCGVLSPYLTVNPDGRNDVALVPVRR